MDIFQWCYGFRKHRGKSKLHKPFHGITENHHKTEPKCSGSLDLVLIKRLFCFVFNFTSSARWVYTHVTCSDICFRTSKEMLKVLLSVMVLLEAYIKRFYFCYSDILATYIAVNILKFRTLFSYCPKIRCIYRI